MITPRDKAVTAATGRPPAVSGRASPAPPWAKSDIVEKRGPCYRSCDSLKLSYSRPFSPLTAPQLLMLTSW
ncbi:hypothetical protein VTN00DRAFT_6931 [Thermoascus crustaceus]|uniref:uncharacterized protein n=1 Tax=Thermoascus crustaceus TaxID=5088 RepID=UPI0037443B49